MTEKYDPLASVQAAGPPGSISFIYGLPDPKTFPVDEIQRCFDQVLRENSALALQYGPEQGYGPLIDFLIERIGRTENLNIARPNLMLTGGATQALDHICSLLTGSDDWILVEAPTYRDSLQLFQDHRLRIRQVPMDEDGLIIDELRDRWKALQDMGEKVKFLYTIPTFQNPTGITLSEKRRKELVDLSKEWGLLIVEDDVYRDIAFETVDLPSLFSLDQSGHVLSIGSFSKIMSPGLRLGWLMGHEKHISSFIDSGFRHMGGGANPLVASALSIFCRKGLLETHIESLRKLYSQRKDVMLDVLDSSMPEGAHWTNPKGGFFVWITLPAGSSAEDLVLEAKKTGLWILAGDRFFAEKPKGQHLRLAFSYVEEDDIRTGIEKLASLLKENGSIF
ncbi:MAG: PLP-dependent aminotransferase family protein [Candidatus Aminicenantes bacterium]